MQIVTIILSLSQFFLSTISLCTIDVLKRLCYVHTFTVFDIRLCIVACGGGQVWKTCGSACTRTCSKQYPKCTRRCVAKCQCPSSAPIWCKGKCIKRSKCPGEQSQCIRKYGPWCINNYDRVPTVLVRRVDRHVLNSHEVCTC